MKQCFLLCLLSKVIKKQDPRGHMVPKSRRIRYFTSRARWAGLSGPGQNPFVLCHVDCMQNTKLMECHCRFRINCHQSCKMQVQRWNCIENMNIEIVKNSGMNSVDILSTQI